MELDILFEDATIIVVIKPAKVPSQKDLSGDLDMVTALTEYIQKKTKTEKSCIGLIHRLDRPVSGIMVFAKTPKANSVLSEQIRLKRMTKQYQVVVCGKPTLTKAMLVDQLLKQGNNLSKVVSKPTKESKEATLNYECLKTISQVVYGELSLLNVELITGRHHQIRVQLAHAGIPIWGDTKYNLAFHVNEDEHNKAWYQIALCAHQLKFVHPKSGKEMSFQMNPSQFPFDQFE